MSVVGDPVYLAPVTVDFVPVFFDREALLRDDLGEPLCDDLGELLFDDSQNIPPSS